VPVEFECRARVRSQAALCSRAKVKAAPRPRLFGSGDVPNHLLATATLGQVEALNGDMKDSDSSPALANH